MIFMPKPLRKKWPWGAIWMGGSAPCWVRIPMSAQSMPGYLSGGTAYVTDIGLTGPIESVIGDDPENVLKRFLTQLPYRLSAGTGKSVVNAILGPG